MPTSRRPRRPYRVVRSCRLPPCGDRGCSAARAAAEPDAWPGRATSVALQRWGCRPERRTGHCTRIGPARRPAGRVPRPQGLWRAGVQRSGPSARKTRRSRQTSACCIIRSSPNARRMRRSGCRPPHRPTGLVVSATSAASLALVCRSGATSSVMPARRAAAHLQAVDRGLQADGVALLAVGDALAHFGRIRPSSRVRASSRSSSCSFAPSLLPRSWR